MNGQWEWEINRNQINQIDNNLGDRKRISSSGEREFASSDEDSPFWNINSVSLSTKVASWLRCQTCWVFSAFYGFISDFQHLNGNGRYFCLNIFFKEETYNECWSVSGYFLHCCDYSVTRLLICHIPSCVHVPSSTQSSRTIFPYD